MKKIRIKMIIITLLMTMICTELSANHYTARYHTIDSDQNYVDLDLDMADGEYILENVYLCTEKTDYFSGIILSIGTYEIKNNIIECRDTLSKISFQLLITDTALVMLKGFPFLESKKFSTTQIGRTKETIKHRVSFFLKGLIDRQANSTIYIADAMEQDYF